MLVAPLIMDLDGRVNVNVHGNPRGANADHRSNQGLGPWEVNLGKILSADPDEWKNLLLGNPPTGAPSRPGRLGANRQPANGGPVPDTYPPAGQLYGPHPYAPVDFDGRDESTGAATGRMQLPSAGGPVLAFPTFPPTGYGNASVQERTSHPLLYDPFKPATYDPNNDDHPFAHANMSRLLHSLDIGGPSLASELISLCPRNLGNPRDVAGSVRRGRMLTTISFDLDRPGVAPWLWYPSGLDTTYKYDGTRGVPVGSPILFPDPALRGQPPATENLFTNSEFSPSGWQAVSPTPNICRLNLNRPLRPYQAPTATNSFSNRPLRPYPAPDPGTGLITDTDAFLAAQQDRQDLAADIFQRLCKLTGATDPDTPVLDPITDEFRALRWLAQLAVNIVDYIDPDDYITRFTWRKGQWVFGTELPRLVLNEAYVQRHAEGRGQRLTAWVELLNPLSPSPTLTNNGDAVLQIGTNPVYQVVLADKDPNLRAPENVAGTVPPRKIKAAVRMWSDPSIGYTAPGDTQYPNGVNVHNTVLRPGLLDLPDPDPTTGQPRHPYQKLELLRKIYNNTTVRSNVFAVWVTVGFFEVKDDTTRPVKLGPEVGRAEGRHVRHRMFAIVDRTNATVFNLQTEENFSPPGTLLFRGGASALSGKTPGGLLWQLKQSVPLVFDPNSGREEITPLGEIPSPLLSPAQISVSLTRPYPVNTLVVGRGNVGPWPRYDPSRDTAVVPYWAIIK